MIILRSILILLSVSIEVILALGWEREQGSMIEIKLERRPHVGRVERHL